LGYNSPPAQSLVSSVTLLALVRYYRINNTGEWLHAGRGARPIIRSTIS
jgi:hypothetical protein